MVVSVPIHYDRDLQLAGITGSVGAALHAALAAHYADSTFVSVMPFGDEEWKEHELLERGAFQPDGPSEAQIWMKYTGAAPSSPVELPADVYRTILEKACTSNRIVDGLCGQGADAAATAAANMIESVPHGQLQM